jgi:membrane protein implicated in regulation of membrane protease activity
LNILQLVPLSDPDFWWVLIVLLIIGLIVIFSLEFWLAFPFAVLTGIVVFFFTGSLLWSGITFLVIASLVAALGKSVRTRRETREYEQEHKEDEH